MKVEQCRGDIINLGQRHTAALAQTDIVHGFEPDARSVTNKLLVFTHLQAS